MNLTFYGLIIIIIIIIIIIVNTVYRSLFSILFLNVVFLDYVHRTNTK
jgi:hypothetical protein